jgi:DNA-binding transcriptional ArsR family regulator
MTIANGADIAAVAALVGEPARARILASLMGGTALTATELALEAEVAPSTASSHLARLTEGRILRVEKQGRHRYFRLDGDEVAEMLESLMGVAERHAPRRRPGPSDPALRTARVCYDHLAGERGVWLLDRLTERNLLAGPASVEFFQRFGIDVPSLAKQRRPLTRTCLDWSERRDHLAGALGAAILQRILALRWARRESGSRALIFSDAGEKAFQDQF